ncbi:MAG: M50 family metallopeptidase [Beutenbergiaceae bacterium]
MAWLNEVFSRLQPVAPEQISTQDLAIAVGCALVVVLVPPLWQVARLGVTLVHELGHAGVGVLVGRKFTGFQLRGDASGHAVTLGRRSGPGLVVTTWAGYPAPALLAAGIASATGYGWGSPLLAALAVILVASMIRVRSLLTGLVTAGTLVLVAALWWWGSAWMQTMALTATAGVLLVGAWRHLLVAATDKSVGNDARVLARLSPVPRSVWLLTYIVVLGWCTWIIVAAW